VNGIVGTPQRLEHDKSTSADNQNEHPHPGSVPVNDINFEDCEADLVYRFQLLVTPAGGYNLDVWAGTQDCSQLSNRQSSSTAVCWPVTSAASNATVTPYTVDVYMRDIVSQVFQTTKSITYSSEAPESVCQLQTSTGSTAISLYFFYEQAENATGTDAVYPINVGLRAGDVQGDISAGVGDTLLIVNVPPTTDTTVQGWNVYCDPPPGEEGVAETVPVDAASNNGVCTPTVPDTGISALEDSSVDSSLEDGASEDAALVDSAAPVVLDDAGGNACGVALNDAQIPSPGGCSASSVLIPGGCNTSDTFTDDAGNTVFEEGGATATSTSTVEEGGTLSCSGGTMRLIPSKYICGTSSGTSTKINVEHLKDGYYYNISVGAVDALGNVGPLSNVVCGEPVPVNDFWKVYYEDGGRAGGGFCSAEGVGTPAGTGGLGVITVASMVAIVRRRRRK
jgi:hypothetical protein